MKKILISLGSIASLGLPMLASAAEFKTDYVDSLMSGATKIISSTLILLISLAVVWFIWNVIKYSMSDEDDGKTKAKEQMIHGIIAIAVIVSIWGIVALLRSAFGTDTNATAPTNLGRMIPGASSVESTSVRTNQSIPTVDRSSLDVPDFRTGLGTGN